MTGVTPGLAVLLVVFAAALLLGVPVAFVLGTATVLAALALGYPSVPLTSASDIGNGIDSFALLAIPFFILAGELMGAGGLARRLIDLAAALVGRHRGGLAMVNTITCMLFPYLEPTSMLGGARVIRETMHKPTEPG